MCVRKALERFKELVCALDCECDEYNGFTCSIHKDRELARNALDKFKECELINESKNNI